MALIEIANSNCTLNHGISPVTGGIFVITSLSSIKVKAGSAGVHRGSINFTFSGGSCILPPCVPGTVTGSGIIPPSAIKVKADNLLVMRKDDNVVITMYGNSIVPPFLPIAIIGCEVKIVTSGQIKVKGQ